MFEILLCSTGLIITLSMVKAYYDFRDPIHPFIFVGPLMLYEYCLSPFLLNAGSQLRYYFPLEPQLIYVQTINFLGVAMFCLGTYDPKAKMIKKTFSISIFSLQMNSEIRRRLFVLSTILGTCSVLAYTHMIFNAGGLIRAYSRAKGGGWAASGYIGETILLSFPAIILLSLSRQGMKLRWKYILMALTFSLPHLFQGILGGRRGPLFLILCILFLSWLIARAHRPSLKTLLMGLLLISFSVTVVWSQRQHMYLGSGGEFKIEAVWEKIRPGDLSSGHNYINSSGSILAAKYQQSFYWGYRYFVTFFIRPIPKQIWPTKYEDMNATWVMNTSAHRSLRNRMFASLGWISPSGSAAGLISDSYMEFYWGFLAVCFIMGRFYIILWKRNYQNGGVWTLFYAIALMLSVYLPTQSLSAWMHRFLFMCVPTLLLWRYYIEPHLHQPVLDAGKSIYESA